MIKILFQKLLNKSGKTYLIDKNIPSGIFLYTLFSRMRMLLRGILFLRRKVFIGKNCLFLNKKNIIIGLNVTFENNVVIDGYASQNVVFGNNVKIGAYSFVTCTSHFSKYGKGLIIGNNTAIGKFSEFGAAGGITIGNDVIMGGYVSFHSENHNFEDQTKPIREQGVNSKGIVLGNNIWVGAKVTFLDGTQLGDNCVVAAGAVVSGVFPDNCIIGGVPAKIIRKMVS